MTRGDMFPNEDFNLNAPDGSHINVRDLYDIVPLTPEGFGAIGDGIVDDTAAIRAAFVYANSLARAGLTGTIFQPGAVVTLKGTYKLTSIAAPIDILCNVEGSKAALIAPDAYAGIVLRVGHTTSGSYFQNAIINLPDVIKSLTATIVAGSVGIKTMNIGNSILTFARTAFFETGIWCSGLGQGTAYNQINIGWISYCQISLKLVPDTAGWCNQNTFVGGGIQQSAGSFGGGLRRAGWRHVSIDGAGINTVNGNLFLGVSFEGDVSEYVIAIASAYNNQFIGCRHEQGTAATSVAVTGGGSATLTTVAHGLAVGNMVTFIAAVTPTGMIVSYPYYVVSVPTADTFTVSAKKGGAAVTFSTTGTTVTYYRPPTVYLDTANTNQNNVIRNPALTTAFGFLELIKSTNVGTGNTIETTTRQIKDDFHLDNMPPFAGRNRSTTPTIRPIFAAHPAASDPVEDPDGWTAALGDGRLCFAAAGAEIGRLTNSGGILSYSANGGTIFEIASCRRSPALITTISGLSLTANTTVTTTVTLTGAAVNDHVVITPAANLPAGAVIAFARVSSADTITIGFGNLTASPISLTVDIQGIAIKRFV